jgi:small conductance mechanosensitive channel
MGEWTRLLSDERLLANLISIHFLLALLLVLSFAVRFVLLHGGERLLRLFGLHRWKNLTDEAERSLRSIVFWLTLGLMLAVIALGIGYHVLGRDIRADLLAGYQQITTEHFVALGLMTGKAVLVVGAVLFALRLARRLLNRIEHAVSPQAHTNTEDSEAPDDVAVRSLYSTQRQTVRRWFVVLHRCASLTALFVALALLTRLIDWTAGNAGVRFAGRLVALVCMARLATLTLRLVLDVMAVQGETHIRRPGLRRYWERVTRLFPFAERCFEAAVYIAAASLVLEILSDVPFFAHYGKSLVECIGIFFGTRVLIELLQVLLNEAFGMYREDRPVDQKGLTLVPLLQSLVQYTLYFGSVIMMLQSLGLPTTPILAGASILGLAGGLGAQSLVTDVVSGFFILFENQYLVGDIVQIGDAQGRIEAVSIRATQIRDEQGRLVTIPNGQIKNVVNYSKGYVNAVVDIKLPTSMSVDQIISDMQEAGRRLRQTRREVLGETVVKGLLDLSPSDMVLRAVTKVQPGTHSIMQNEYRRLLKEVFDTRSTAKAA